MSRFPLSSAFHEVQYCGKNTAFMMKVVVLVDAHRYMQSLTTETWKTLIDILEQRFIFGWLLIMLHFFAHFSMDKSHGISLGIQFWEIIS